LWIALESSVRHLTVDALDAVQDRVVDVQLRVVVTRVVLEEAGDRPIVGIHPPAGRAAVMPDPGVPGLVREVVHRGLVPGPDRVLDGLPMPKFRLTRFGADAPRFEKGERDSREGTRFKTGIGVNAEIFRASAEAGAETDRPVLDVGGFAGAVLAKIDPEVTVPRRVLTGLHLPDRVRGRELATFRKVLAYPEIDVPTYRPLVGRSAELFRRTST
jgi:hypothetical protein